VCQTVKPNYGDLKEVCLYLSAPQALDPNAALGVYVSCGGTDWQYRGCISSGRPSDVFPTNWPTAGQDLVAGGARIGISVEPRAELEQKESTRLGKKEEFAKRVALDLFRFLESFNSGCVTQVTSDQLVVPANFLDRWFTKFQSKFRRDPDFLTRDRDKA